MLYANCHFSYNNNKKEQIKKYVRGSEESREREVVHTKDNGGYSVGVPPLPIPNREVKPYSADGTAIVGE